MSFSFVNAERRFDINKQKQRIGENLLSKVKTHMQTFGVHTAHNYPYLDVGTQGVSFHIGTDERWITIKDYCLGFISTHNLDAVADRIVAFNVGADVLEYLDREVLASRIFLEEGNPVMKYPLPEGFKKIPIEHPELRYFLREGRLEKVFKIGGAGTITKKDLEGERQEILCEKGLVVLGEGMCEGRNFEGYDICKATFPIAKLVDSCSFK